MKTTKYFEFRRQFPDRLEITDSVVQSVIDFPIKRIEQDDGRIRIWGRVGDSAGRYLRVVLLEDGETVHNAFFDRGFKE